MQNGDLIQELNKIIGIYTKELKDWREGKGKGTFLLDEDMFNVVMKLLDKSDKIKRLNVVEADAAPAEENTKPKITNLQEWTLNKSKA